MSYGSVVLKPFVLGFHNSPTVLCLSKGSPPRRSPLEEASQLLRSFNELKIKWLYIQPSAQI
jgi:hypothetical protein